MRKRDTQHSSYDFTRSGMKRGLWGQAAEVCALANDLTSWVHSFRICEDGDDDSSMDLRGCLWGPNDIKKNEKAQPSLKREKQFWNYLLFGSVYAVGGRGWGKLRCVPGQASDVWAGGDKAGRMVSAGETKGGRRAGDGTTRGAMSSIFMLFDSSCTAMHGFSYRCGQIF